MMAINIKQHYWLRYGPLCQMKFLRSPLAQSPNYFSVFNKIESFGKLPVGVSSNSSASLCTSESSNSATDWDKPTVK